jgi:hypothetical protein
LKSFILNFFKKNRYLILVAAVSLIAGYLTGFLLKSSVSDRYWQHSIESFLQEREKDFIKTCKNQKLLDRLCLDQYSEETIQSLIAKKYTLLIYKKKGDGKPDLVFWNSQELILPDSQLIIPDGNYFTAFQNGQYELVKRSIQTGQNDLIVAGLIPIHKQFYISVSGFKPEFENFPLVESRFRISDHPPGLAVQSSFGQNLFYLE